jgi:murein DD-endopeptidase MepM/ murein hydrolase activator NlpD
VDNPQEHFWLSKPLPGGGRMLYTDWLPYGYDAGGRYLLHNGVDVADPMGTALLAAADGQVIVAGPDANLLYGWRCDWYGNLVVIELDQRWGDKPVYILYGHVLNISVEAGQHVNLGEQLAEVGIGGAAGNPHLHFEVRLGTNEFQSTRNPFLWLQPPDTRGIIVGRLIDPQGRPWQGVAITAVGRSEGAENRTSWTYLGDPQGLIKPDEEFAENFVIPDLRPGMYELYVELQEQIYQVPVEIHGGQMVRAEIITEPYKTPTPETPTQPAESPPESMLETSTPQG